MENIPGHQQLRPPREGAPPQPGAQPAAQAGGAAPTAPVQPAAVPAQPQIIFDQQDPRIQVPIGPPNYQVVRPPRKSAKRPVIRYTAEQKQNAIRLLSQGLSFRTVARMTSPHCSNETISRWRYIHVYGQLVRRHRIALRREQQRGRELMLQGVRR